MLGKVGWLVAAKVCIALVALVFAASIAVSSSTYQAEVGSVVNVVNGFLAIDKGFSPAGTGSGGNGTSCSSPVTFSGTPGTANTNITAGHLVYDVQINWTSAPASTKFNVTLVVGSTTYGPLCIQTPSSSANGEIIDCKFDVGTSLPASPYSFKITVQ
jgi:hypothetical protein